MKKSIISTLFLITVTLVSVQVCSAKEAKQAVDFPVDSKAIDRTNSTRVTSYAPILKKPMDAVVAVTTENLIKVSRGDPMQELLRRFYGMPPSRAPRNRGSQEEEQLTPGGIGSGVIVSSDGYILTNNHVISNRDGEKVDRIMVKLFDGREFEATIVGSDEKTDVAVIKVDAADLPSVPMADSGNLLVGDVVFAIGNPMAVGMTVTKGIISATSRSQLGILGEHSYENFIQTDAAINPGNSGGGLVDAEGRLIGINTAIMSRSGGSNGIGFAIPVNIARGVMMSLVNTGEVQRGFLGVGIADLDKDMAEAFGLESIEGALIQKVEEGLAADNAGIKRGDILIEVDGKKIKSASDLRLIVSAINPGTKVDIRLIREEKELTVVAVLGNLGDPYGTGIGSFIEILDGVLVEPVNDELRETYDLPENVSGLVITEVKQGSPYGSKLRIGMVFLEINGETVADQKDAQKLLRRGINKIYLYFNGYQHYFPLRLR